MFIIKIATFCSTTTYSEERSGDDEVFRGKFKDLAVGCVAEDPTYNNPDVKRYYFTNMKDRVSAIDRQGRVCTVRLKSIPLSILNTNEMMKRFGVEDNEGVYVVDYTYNYDGYGHNLQDVVNWYSDVYPNMEEHILPHVRHKAVVKNVFTGSGNKIGHDDKFEFSVRLVHFIPAATIRDNNYIYDNTTDTVFACAMVDRNVMHPFSKAAMNKVEDQAYDLSEPNKVVIDVINNTTSCTVYTNIGGHVYTLNSRQDVNRTNGVYFKTNINLSTRQEEYIPFENCKEHGVYFTREEAYANCSMDKIIESKKITNVMKELENKNKELTFRDSELEFKYAELTSKNKDLENKVISLNLELDVLRKKKELEVMKMNHEVKMLSFKTKMEVHKMIMDVSKDQIAYKKDIMKFNMETYLFMKKAGREESDNLFRLSDFILKGATALMNKFI